MKVITGTKKPPRPLPNIKGKEVPGFVMSPILVASKVIRNGKVIREHGVPVPEREEI